MGRSLSHADIDGDGDLDVLFTANGDRPRLFRNDLPDPDRGLRVRLIGAGRNRDALGAVVIVDADGRRQKRVIRTGGSYLSQSELTATFGLGSARKASVEVRWPMGRTEPIGELEAGFVYTIEEGVGVTRADRYEAP